MNKIQIFCPEFKKFMLINTLHKHDLGQDIIPKAVANELKGQTHICEHCGVLHELRPQKIHRVDVKMVF